MRDGGRRGERAGDDAPEQEAPRPGSQDRIAARYPALAKAMPAAGAGEPTIHDAATAAVEHKDAGGAVDSGVAARVGAHLGADLSGVRVHQDPLAQEASAAMGARAFAHGGDVFLGAGERGDDLGLMAHELTHVVQQGAAGQRLPQRRVEVGDANTPAEREADQVASAVTGGTGRPAQLLVDEGPPQPGQMLKSEFLEALRPQVVAVADAELGPIYSAIGCPYIEQYFRRYASASASESEALLRRFAPGVRTVARAADMIPLVVERVRAGVQTWRSTGQAPPELAGEAAAGGGAAPAQAMRTTGDGPSLASLEAELGPGQPLDGATAARLSALGLDGSDARIHTGPVAARKADEVDALAFVAGTNVVLASSAPAAGTLEGDALLAHELAHVAQQRDAAGDAAARAQPLGAESATAEKAADGAVASAARGDKTTERMKSGLQLQRCGRNEQAQAPQVTHVSNQITDGPFGWQQEFDVTFTADAINVLLKPKLALDAGVTPEQGETAKTRSRTQFRAVFDNKFVLTDTASNQAYNLRVDVQFVDAGEHYTITLHPNSGGTNRRNWYVNDSDTDLAHELGHQLGLKDEYVDATVPDRATAAGPGVHTDHSIMGNYPVEGVAAAEAKLRHGQTVANEIGGATGHTYTVARRP